MTGLSRTSFNFAIGRDWWCWGPGRSGRRTGGTCGGAASSAGGGGELVDMRPVAEPNGYSRRRNVYPGVFLATQVTVEVPMGAWIGFIGGRAEWGYDWTNLLRPAAPGQHQQRQKPLPLHRQPVLTELEGGGVDCWTPASYVRPRIRRGLTASRAPSSPFPRCTPRYPERETRPAFIRRSSRSRGRW